MKKIIGISTITLGLLLSANSALAENQIGQSLCGFSARVLQNAGYTNNTTMTGEGLLQLFRAINVDASSASIIPTCTYHTYYRCDVQNNLATPSICFSPTTHYGKEQVVSWQVTKPNYQDQDYNYES